MDRVTAHCRECGRLPARVLVHGRDGRHVRLCGVCWHRGRVLQDMFARIRAWRADREQVA